MIISNTWYLGLLSISYFYLALKEPNQVISAFLSIFGVIAMLGVLQRMESKGEGKSE